MSAISSKTATAASSSKAAIPGLWTGKTEIYAAWFGDMRNIKDQYIKNLTKTARLNPKAEIILYIDAQTPQELAEKKQAFNKKAGKDAARIKLISIYDQLIADIESDKKNNETDNLPKGLGNTILKTLIPEIENDIKISKYQGYAYLKDIMMYYTAATKLDKNKRIILLDLDITPIKSFDTIFSRKGNLPIVLNFHINQLVRDRRFTIKPGENYANILADFFAIQGNPVHKDNPYLNLKKLLRTSFIERLSNFNNNKKQMVKECAFCNTLASDIELSLNAVLTQDINKLEPGRLLHLTPPPEHAFINMVNPRDLTTLSDKSPEQHSKEVRDASARIIQRFLKNKTTTKLILPKIAEEKAFASRFPKAKISSDEKSTTVTLPKSYLIPRHKDKPEIGRDLRREVRTSLNLDNPKVIKRKTSEVKDLLENNPKAIIQKYRGTKYLIAPLQNQGAKPHVGISK